MRQRAEQAVERAKRLGASDAAAIFSEGRFIELEQRDGKLEKLREADSASMTLRLYVDGRYSAHSSSDLRPEALERFVAQSVAMTRLLDEDPHRRLLDPKFYPTLGQDEAGIDIDDPGYDAVTADYRRAVVKTLEAAARSVEGPIISATGGWYDRRGRSVRVHSNGFVGESRASSFWMGASVSVEDKDGRKPQESWWVGARHKSDLPEPEGVGQKAARRTLERLGQSQMDSGAMTLVLENKVVGRLLGHWMRGLYGEALQQKRSFLMDKLGERVGSARFTLVDDPTIARGLGSRVFDGEGYAARRRTLVEGGVLKTFLIGSYYANKMGIEPTGGATGNLIIPPGDKSRDAIIAGVERGVLVTGILGGNSDTTRGDFSHGIQGFAIEKGKLGGPVGEMNVSGDHSKLWDRLVEVGDDPYPWSSLKAPTLVFDGVSVSGR